MRQLPIPAEDKLDKYRSYLFDKNPIPLNSGETQMLEKYNKAWSLQCRGYTRQQTVNALTRLYGLSTPQCYAIIRDAAELLGNVQESTKEAKRAIQIERFRRLAQKAEKGNDFMAAARLEENAAKLENLYDHSKGGLDPKDFLKPVAIIFSSDVNVLKEQQKAKQLIEDVGYEEIQ